MTVTEMLSIIYVSSAVELFDDSHLDELLLGSRKFNLEHAITGVLLYEGGNFMQCIEGPADSVLAAYDRIKASRRHTDLVEMNRAKVVERSFSSWEMGLLRPRKSEFVSMANVLSLATQKDNSSAVAIGLMKNFITTIRAN